jgi:stage II sporulation protein D
LAVVGWLRPILLALGVALIGAQGAQAGVLVIDGAGDGHGVGMSQTGAEGLALHGYDARQILTHYYTGTAVGRIAPRLITVLLQSRLRSVVFSDATRAGTRPLDPAHT